MLVVSTPIAEKASINMLFYASDFMSMTNALLCLTNIVQ